MSGARRRTDALIAALELVVLLAALLGGALSNVLPALVSAEVQPHSRQIFSGAVVVALLLTLLITVLQPRSAQARLARRRQHVLVVLRVLQGGVLVVAGVFGNLVAQALQASPLVIGLAVAALGLVVFLPLLSDVLRTGAKRQKTDREAFLGQLNRRYDVFLQDDPLQRAVRAALGVIETPAALRRPEVTVESLDAEAGAVQGGEVVMLGPEDSLLEVYEMSGGHLLILGAPGAGKSTQLHELGRVLVKRAQKDGTAPLPVILDLSTWARDKDPLERWLVDAIVEAYDVRKDIAAGWVEEEQIALLLDALDVMADDDQPRCVEKINKYRAAHPKVKMAVCSKLEEYQRISRPVGLQRAVTLQPLSDRAINDALASGGATRATLREVVREDATLRDALRTPLILSLVVLTYSDLRSEEIPRVTDLTAWRSQLFSRYVDRMLHHQPGTEGHALHYPEETFNQTLAWLGYEMRAHKAGTFHLERLQPDWAPQATAQSDYLVARSGLELIIGLGVGVFGWLFVDLISGMVGFDLLASLVGWLIGGLYVGLSFERFIGEGKIEPVAHLRWSWRGAQDLVVSGLVFGLVFGLVGLLVNGLGFGWVGFGWRGFLGLVGFGFAVQLGFMIESQHVNEQDFSKINEGIRRSIQSCLVGGLLGGLFLGLGFGLLGGLFLGPGSGSVGLLGFGLGFGGVVGLLGFGLSFGGTAALKHLALRLALRRSGVVPRGLVRFLDEASRVVLLRRVGGGYQFIHQLLRDYFADQYVPREKATREGNMSSSVDQ